MQVRYTYIHVLLTRLASAQHTYVTPPTGYSNCTQLEDTFYCTTQYNAHLIRYIVGLQLRLVMVVWILKYLPKLVFKNHLVLMLCRYFRSMFYSELLYASASNIPLVLKRKMHSAIHQFLKSADYTKIREHEKKNGYIWSTVTPIVKLVYLPRNDPSWTFCTYKSSEDVNEEMRELEDLCIEAGVFSLQNMMLCDETSELLIAEHVLDFVVCMPWHLTKGTNAHKRACDLNTFLGHKMQIQPPSLVNMTKAKLATMHFGLEKVMNASSVHELVNEIM